MSEREMIERLKSWIEDQDHEYLCTNYDHPDYGLRGGACTCGKTELVKIANEYLEDSDPNRKRQPDDEPHYSCTQNHCSEHDPDTCWAQELSAT